MRNPADTALEWSMTLVEPLMDPRRRQRLEEEFATVARYRPGWTAAFLGGVLADVAGTFPTYDPWRHLSARIGRLTVGANPPDELGARRPLGETFGVWAAADDHPFGGRPEREPSLVAIADDLAPPAAALVAFAHCPWAEVQAAVAALWRELVGRPLPASVACVDDARPYHLEPAIAAAVGEWHAAGCAALRRVIFRRRTYWGGMDDDPLVLDACFRWTVFASDLAAGETLDDDVITGPIALGRELLTDLHHGLSVPPGTPMSGSENDNED